MFSQAVYLPSPSSSSPSLPASSTTSSPSSTAQRPVHHHLLIIAFLQVRVMSKPTSSAAATRTCLLRRQQLFLSNSFKLRPPSVTARKCTQLWLPGGFETTIRCSRADGEGFDNIIMFTHTRLASYHLSPTVGCVTAVAIVY
ncbi:hypothetical protein M8C21_024341 [Ambrosia artemisiifolia]|uniref:Uncharacterized protein n=1 Tax=Ambrosia artemisiifolia TaxID=4212 RepID=A0AAD5DCQ5_AMBAR|nr:hypothetical protein M8C21_024341 [Ambrosia artemisiifolia]